MNGYYLKSLAIANFLDVVFWNEPDALSNEFLGFFLFGKCIYLILTKAKLWNILFVVSS